MPDLAIYALSRGATTPEMFINQLHIDWDSDKLCTELELKEIQDLAYIDPEAHLVGLYESEI